MKKRIFSTLFACAIALGMMSGLYAQEDPDIDMYISSWKQSFPKTTHGTLVVRDILTPGDQSAPEKPGAVLKFAKQFARGVLESYVRTEPTTHEGVEEILYTVKGKGRVESGSISEELTEGTGVLVPPGVEHTIINESAEPLELLVLQGEYRSPNPPPKNIVVKNYHALPVHAGGHWTHIVRNLFLQEDGMGGFYAILLVSIDGMNIAEPHPHGPDDEECWHALKGKSLLWMGKEIRWQPEGTAFMIPQTRKTTHANINIGHDPVMFFYFRTFPRLDSWNK